MNKLPGPLLKFLRTPAIPLRLRKKVGKLISVPKNIDFTIDVFGQIYKGKTGTHLDDKVYMYGRHEAPTLRLIRIALKLAQQTGQDNTDYMDIGTNSGLHLITAAPFAGKAVGFEPWTKIYKIADNNIQANKLDNTRLYPFALGDKQETREFYVPQGGNLGVGSFVETECNDDPTPLALEIREGDKIVREEKIKPAVVKIDTEGFEAAVLRGLRKTIQEYRPAVIFEYSSKSARDIDPPGALDEFFGPDYMIYGILRSREMLILKTFVRGRKYENLLAWPQQRHTLMNMIKRGKVTA